MDVVELSDLEICKDIADINGDEVLEHKGFLIRKEDFSEVINTTCSGRYAPSQVVNIIERASYSPLTDDALCFQLMIKHKVELDFSQGVFTQATVPDFKSDDETATLSCVEYWHDDHSHNKAICLAIIESKPRNNATKAPNSATK